MEREQIITAGIDPSMLGIEVGPWFRPLAPKRKGFNSLTLDVYDRDKLLDHAKSDDSITPDTYDLIEHVDLVGGATSIAQLVEDRGLTGQIDYVISSHNFEHLPNPILFLQGCQRILKPTGFVSMAIPDRRGCFDFFRPISTTAQILDAAHREISHPTPAQAFDDESLRAARVVDGNGAHAWNFDDDGSPVCSNGAVELAYEKFKNTLSRPPGSYFDCHCFVFTRSSFELIVRDLHFLGIIDLGVERMEGPAGCEFYARLSKQVPVPTPAAYQAKRGELLHDILDEIASNSRCVTALKKTVTASDQTRPERVRTGANLLRYLQSLLGARSGRRRGAA